MGTLEERVQALETLLSAAAGTTPYNSPYTGPQIDNAVSRALPSGSIDASIQKKPNPNLLDNWYFGNPVDQRGGYVVPPGKTYYISGGEIGGVTDRYYNATLIRESDTYSYWSINVDGVTRYVTYNDAVRGYTGHEMYGLDRWMITNGSALVVHDGYISAYYPSGAQGRYLILQAIENYEVFKGKQVTFSVLADHIAGDMCFVVYWNYLTYAGQYVPLKNGMNVLTCTIPDDANTLCVAIGSQNIGAACSVDLFAGKLELGTTQTLAHQDENDVWVLNEIPDYGEQLAKCQRYQNVEKGAVHSVYGRTEGGGTSLSLTLPLPVTPRANGNITIPSMTVAGNGGAVTVAEVNTTAVAKQNGIYFVVSGDFASIGNSEVVNCYLGAGYIADFNL